MLLKFFSTLASVITLAKSAVETCSDNALKSPDLSRSFGDPITEDEVQEYDRWYNSLEPGVTRWPDESPSDANSSLLWYDNRGKQWAWNGTYIMFGLLNMWRMTGQTCTPDATATATASSPSVLGYFEEMERHIDYICEMTDFSRHNRSDSNAQMDYIQQRYLHSWAQSTTTCTDCDEGQTCDSCPEDSCPVDDSLDTCGDAYGTNVIQTFMTLDPITELSYLILKLAPDNSDDSSRSFFDANNMYCCTDNNKGKTVFEKAAEWIELAVETIDDYFYPYDMTGNEINQSWIGVVDGYGWSIRNPDTIRFVQMADMFHKADKKRGQFIATNRMLVAATVLSHVLGVKDSNYLNAATADKIKDREEMWLKLIENVLRVWNADKSFYGASNEYVNWSYAAPSYDTRAEDSAHGEIDMRAFVRLYELNMTQTIDWNPDEPIIETLNKFGRSFAHIMSKGDGTVSQYVTGTGDCSSRTREEARWSSLISYRVCKDDIEIDKSDCDPNEVMNVIKSFYHHSYGVPNGNKGFGFTTYIYNRGGCHGQNGCNYPLQYVTGKLMNVSDSRDVSILCQSDANPPSVCAEEIIVDELVQE